MNSNVPENKVRKLANMLTAYTPTGRPAWPPPMQTFAEYEAELQAAIDSCPDFGVWLERQGPEHTHMDHVNNVSPRGPTWFANADHGDREIKEDILAHLCWETMGAPLAPRGSSFVGRLNVEELKERYIQELEIQTRFKNYQAWISKAWTEKHAAAYIEQKAAQPDREAEHNKKIASYEADLARHEEIVRAGVRATRPVPPVALKKPSLMMAYECAQEFVDAGAKPCTALDLPRMSLRR